MFSKKVIAIFIFLFFIISQQSFAQTPTIYQVSGKIVDSAKVALPFCTVMLLAQKDSALIHYTRSDEEGNFKFKNLRRGNFLVKVSYVGYLPTEKKVEFGDNAEINMGNFVLKPIATELLEVVVRTAKAPLEIRGDTIEYNAASFKVPPGSSVEDLLRKIPGVVVDVDGNIKSQGKDVKRVTVDGKTFFGEDPKTATKNLPAEAISKIQVFDTQTEQAKATGISDGKKEKTMNLELKDEFKNGGFGKITAGVGTQERMEAKGYYNKFDKKNQFSLIGLGNNTNQSGLSWNDYQDFRGSSSFNTFSDNADFGFGGSGRYFMFSDDNNESLTIPIGGGTNKGFSKNYALGANYNYDNKKTKLNSNYYFSANEMTLDALRNRESFIPTNAFGTNENSKQLNSYGNHRLGLRLEHDLDSMNKITVISNSRIGQSDLALGNAQDFFATNNRLISQSALANNTTGLAIATANSIIFRHKFKKRGRSLAASASYILNQGDNKAIQNSTNFFYNLDTLARRIAQENSTYSTSSQLKSSVIYVEPISKKFYWETFMNLGFRSEKVDRNVFDKKTTNDARLDSLSSFYTSQILFARSGTSLRYANKGLNVAFGVALQNFQMQGQFASGQNKPTLADINRLFTTIIPNASLNWDLPNNKYLYANYDVGVNQPTTRNLQPVIDNANPLYIQKGNPNLVPEVTQDLNIGFGSFNPASFFSYNASLSLMYHANQIIYNQTVDTQTLITTVSPENVSGRKSIGSYFYSSFPIVKTKLTMNGNFNFGISDSPIFINGTKNQTFEQDYTGGLGFSFTPADFFTAYGNASWNYNKADYSLASALPQDFHNRTYRLETNIRFPYFFFISTSLNYNTYTNDRMNFNRSIALLNASIYKLFGKEKKFEVRLSGYDMLNQNVGISQTVTQNFVSREVVQTLARYFMLSVSYNMRGIKSDIRKKNNW